MSTLHGSNVALGVSANISAEEKVGSRDDGLSSHISWLAIAESLPFGVCALGPYLTFMTQVVFLHTKSRIKIIAMV